MCITSNNIITVKGCKNQLDSKNKFLINEDTIIELKGEFRSAGKNKSIVYFGLKCFREDGIEITREDINRTDESLLITSINTDNKAFSLHKKPETWNNKNDSLNNTYNKLIGIYFDGNTNHLPDYLLKSPAYNNYDNNCINLCNEIPKNIVDKIIPFKTKVMNHNSGNGCSFDYSVILGETIPEQWKEYSATYEGFSQGYGDIKGKFRLGTKQVQPFIICNYGQNEDAILEIRNIEIIVKDKPKFF